MKQSATIRSGALRLSALALALALLLGLLPPLSGLWPAAETARAATGDAALDQLVSWGVIGGYPDGSLGVERALTRAEFAAMINRAYGYSEGGETPFQDVPESAWYADDIAIGYNSGYYTGVSPRRAQPDATLTREQALVMIGRNMRLEPVGGEVTEFADGRSFSAWSAPYARSAAQDGLIGGYQDGTFRPQNNITRGEMALMLQRALGTLINNPGTHTLNDVYGNVTVSSPGAVLADSTIAGNLYITGGLGLGDITLENVRVLGDIVIAGGGESQSGESVILRNVEADSLTVDSMAGQYVSLAAEGNTLIPETVLKTDTYIQDRTRPGEGFQTISLESVSPAATFSFSGNLETIVNRTPLADVNIAMGTVANYVADEEGIGSTLNLDVNSTVKQLNLDTATPVTGVGAIDKLYVDAPGSEVEMLPDDITIRPGLTATVAGEEMNAAQAIESSADPRLLAGYPKLKNVASKTATAVFETNKAGTVYWAVSATVDGSIGEEELVSPTSGNNRIVLSGSTNVTAANTEFTAAITKLTPDTGYYLSTVMVDARGRYSPVKVVSFHTPDDTVPAFAAGYPRETQNDHEFRYLTDSDGNKIKDENGNDIIMRDPDTGSPLSTYHVQIGSMSAKTCQLYYALYEEGSTAPTAAQFRSGALGQPLRSGVEDSIKNRFIPVDFNGLREQTTYDAYFCLIDADGGLSSPVSKVTFTTKDGTPPIFQYETPAVTAETTAGFTISANVNEDATVYWAVSRDSNYIKDSASWTDEEWWRSACRQIESGTNAIRAGSQQARAGQDAPIAINGLQPATRYYVYFVAKDRAGNYSEFTKENVMPFHFWLRQSTSDDQPPTVEQNFSHPDETNPDMPYADTDIDLIFNEEVMKYTANRDLPPAEFKSFYTYYQAVAEAAASGDAAEIAEAKETLGNVLRSCITLYNTASMTLEGVPDRALTGDEDWVIDFREAVVKMDMPATGMMTITLPHHPQSGGANGALQLASGSTYYFVLDDIADVSSSINRMGRTTLDRFTTVSAQVNLNALNVTSITVPREEGEAGYTDTISIPVDVSFSLTPRTTNVEDSVDWDMIFWSDGTVKFQVYELEGPNNGTAARAVRKVADGEETGAPSSEQIIIPNTYPSSSADINEDDYTGYIGKSLFRDFYKLDYNPSVTGEGEGNVISRTNDTLRESGVLKPQKTKYYGIHFTSVNYTDESSRTRSDPDDNSNSWEVRQILFRVCVLTGTSPSLGTLSRIQIDQDNLADAEANWGIVQIQSPKPFTLRASFTDTTAPGFIHDYPQIKVYDINAEISVQLTRPGTLYYAVVPVEERAVSVGGAAHTSYTVIKTTTISSAYVSGAYENYDPPHEIDEEAVRDLIPQFGDNKPALLAKPANNEIHTPDYDPAIIYGNVKQVGSTGQSIRLDGLTPDTLYFVYFVTQGLGATYSEQTMLYQFRTELVTRPKLKVTGHATTATVATMNMDAIGDYALFDTAHLPDELKDPFYLHMKTVDSDGNPLLVVGDDGAPIITGGAFTFTDYAPAALRQWLTPDKQVSDAICEQNTTEGGSLYDEYALAENKEELRKYMTKVSSTTSHMGYTEGHELIVGANPDEVYFEDEDSGFTVNKGRYYLFIASAASVYATNPIPDAYGFSGNASIHISDYSPPSIQTMIGNGFVNLTDDARVMGGTSGTYNSDWFEVSGNSMSGKLVLTFDKRLYYYAGRADNIPFSAESGDNVPDGEISYTAFQNSGSSSAYFYMISGEDVGQGGGINCVTIGFRNVPVNTGATFYANANVVSAEGEVDLSSMLGLRVRYDWALKKIVADIASNREDWYYKDSEELEPTIIEEPPLRSITFVETAGTVMETDTIEAAVTLSPTYAQRNILVSVTDETGANTNLVTAVFDDSGATPVVRITGVRMGTANVKLTDSYSSVTTPTAYKVTVKPKTTIIAPKTTLNRGESVTLTLDVGSLNLNSIESWTSSNPAYATVSTPIGDPSAAGYDPGGVVTAVSATPAGGFVRIGCTFSYYNENNVLVTDTVYISLTIVDPNAA